MGIDYVQKVVGDFEMHSPDGIRECFEHGVLPDMIYRGKPLIYELINMYLRGPRFKSCVQVFVDHGVKFDDKVLLAILLDDAASLDNLLRTDGSLLQRKYSFECAFTPLFEASLLHICAEYNHLACAKVLIAHGMDFNVRAGLDARGFGGQTPIFHCVNQHANSCVDVMKFLVAQGADLLFTVPGLVWGNGYEWETFIPAVNPISYAMMGLLRQFQRTEQQIYEVVSMLMKSAYGIAYFPQNVPNRYLGKS